MILGFENVLSMPIVIVGVTWIPASPINAGQVAGMGYIKYHPVENLSRT